LRVRVVTEAKLGK